MSDFKAEMHQIRFRLGLCPSPRWGSLQRSPDLLAGFKGPTSKGREEREMDGEGTRREENGREEAPVALELAMVGRRRPLPTGVGLWGGACALYQGRGHPKASHPP